MTTTKLEQGLLEQSEVTTAHLDHLGLVAAICKDLKIAQKIDNKLAVDSNRKVSPGQAIVAMILNGLGYTDRTLYMTDHFFTSKPIDRLLDANLHAEDLTNYTLAHALDDIATYGPSKLFMEIAMEIALENDLLGALNHLDSTTFSLQGSDYPMSEEPQSIHIKRGHSKDHRPDLKQVVLAMVVNGPSSIPIFMEALSGNSSDQISFHQTIQKVQAFKKQINLDIPCKWVADSALYSKDKLLKNNDYTWLTRVPETNKEAKKLINLAAEEITWKEQENGYKTSSYTSHYGGIAQRWLLVYSEQSYEREKRTLEEKVKKAEKEAKQGLWHLSNQIFSTQPEGEQAVQVLQKKYKFITIEYEIVRVEGYLRVGKPKQGDKPVLKGYQVVSTYQANKMEVSRELSKKGRFILATNDLDQEGYTDQAMLQEYKGQAKVERGFRFLKDPWFMVDSIYLKLPSRISSLMMVMSLTLLVYNVGQYKVRKELKQTGETLPNQLGKEISTPTLRWIFQLMEGIGMVYLMEGQTGRKRKEYVTNVSPIRAKIIGLFGARARGIYAIKESRTAA